MALSHHIDDTKPNNSTRLIDEATTLILGPGYVRPDDKGLRPLALFLTICAGSAIWAVIFYLVHLISQIF